MAKKILVTGGAGFIGSHLCKFLVQQKNQVICLDNFYSSTKQNLTEIINHPSFSLINQDVTESLSLEVDEIYNLACPASPVSYQRDPVYTTRTNVLGAFNLLELAKQTGAKILQASTSEVYGDPAVHPQVESYWGNVNPIGIRSCYDEGKRCAETLFFDYHRQYDLTIKVVRIFNTYGPLMRPDDGRVVSNFIVQALNNKPLTIYGNGEQTRSFCYIDDLIRALVLMMETKNDFLGPVNLGNPAEFTIQALAEQIIQLTGSKSTIVYQTLPGDDPKIRKPDISLARAKLKWQPVIQLQEGLEKTVLYFSDRLGRN